LRASQEALNRRRLRIAGVDEEEIKVGASPLDFPHGLQSNQPARKLTTERALERPVEAPACRGSSYVA
jgi:hypothetical protein